MYDFVSKYSLDSQIKAALHKMTSMIIQLLREDDMETGSNRIKLDQTGSNLHGKATTNSVCLLLEIGVIKYF
jgi:hypothetical protein